nr:M15 family metallopeptidase [Saprospiraceae bacterium]
MKVLIPLFALIGLFLFSCQNPEERGMKSEEAVKKGDSQDITDEKESTLYDIDFLTGKFEPDTHPDFVSIEEKYASREGMYMQRDAYHAFLKMYEAAKEEGIELVVRSATRNFEAQKRIWEEKWEGLRLSAGENAKEAYPDPVDRALNILLYSSMPGTSRHHWGTDIDLNSFDNSWFEEGEGEKLYNWMLNHAANYGFCQPYTALNAERKTGYQEEKWHWSYLPLSSDMTKAAKNKLQDEMIAGFKGAETANEIGVVNNYILGIHPDCID